MLDERDVLGASLAFDGWSAARRLNKFKEMSDWEAACERHACAQSDIAEFFRLSWAETPSSVMDRFLSNPPTLLAILGRQRSQRNKNPMESAHLGRHVYQWISGHSSGLDVDDRLHIAGQSALSVTAGLALADRYPSVEQWARISRDCFSKVLHPAPWLAKVDLVETIALHNQHQSDEVLSRVKRLRPVFEAFGMGEELVRCWLLQALALKSLGHFDEALFQIDQVSSTEHARKEPLVLGIALVNKAEVLASTGALSAALDVFEEAVSILQGTEVSWAIGTAEAVLGEVLRDRGQLDAAIPLYRSAIERHSKQQLDGRAAYFRLLLCEALLMAGREDEATQELLAALAALDGESPGPAACTAIALLRESIRRQKADPEALRTLKLELQKMREGNQS